MNLYNKTTVNAPLTLSELNEQIRNAISTALPNRYWLRAETSDVRVNAASGHCYLEFIEKDTHTGQIVAKARAAIWARTYSTLKPYFERITGRPFASGLKVMVNVGIEFHKLYGYSLTIYEIDPSYTLGDLARRKQEAILRLKTEGLFDQNKQVPFPTLPQRIAIVTSPTAAGYEDFANQLLQNPAGYVFYIKLFPAVMQGEKTEESIIEALNRIARYAHLFDAVALIRGGGATSDLNCFDAYTLAAHCARYPLPIITGIGHERDDSVVDMVAHTRMKTPTAVAAFLISKIDEQAEIINRLQEKLVANIKRQLAARKTELQLLATRYPVAVMQVIAKNKAQLASMTAQLANVHLLIQKRQSELDSLIQRMRTSIETFLKNKRHELEQAEQVLKITAPENILKRGYALVTKQGIIIKRTAALTAGDVVDIRHSDGKRTATIQ